MMLARTTLFLALSVFLGGGVPAAQQLGETMQFASGADKFKAYVEEHDHSVRARATGPTLAVRAPSFTEMIAADRDSECLLVRFRAAEPTFDSIAALGLEPLKRLKLISGLWRVRVPAGAIDVELLERLNAEVGILYAEPDYRIEVAQVPNDPNITGTSWWLDQINAFEAWDEATDATAIGPIGIFDTGVNPNHEDVAANMWVNPGEIVGNGVDDDGNGYVDDIHGIAPKPTGQCHGTPVAGTICGHGDNGVGYAGASWRALVMDLTSVGSFAGTVAAVAEGMDYALSFGCRLSNHSWRIFAFSQVLADTVTQAEAAGHLMCCAAGNENDNVDVSPTFPATLPNDNVISVAASTQSEAKISYSSYGAVSVDLAAPTEYPVATCSSDSAYATFGGTSQATPTVCGAVALAWAQDPSMSYLEMRDKLMASVRVSPLWAGLTVTEGLLDMQELVVDPDTDGDGILNEFDPDDDNDGVLDENDDLPLDPTETVDTDGDGIGNNADEDDDNDGVNDVDDFAPFDSSEQYDTDGDGFGDNLDDDDDGDGVLDGDDDLPLDPTETVDSDGDGVGDNSDVFPSNPDESSDFDGDGIGDNGDVDLDNDGLVDEVDSLTRIPVATWNLDYVGVTADGNSITYDGAGSFGWERQASSLLIEDMATLEAFELSFVLGAGATTGWWAFGISLEEQGPSDENLQWNFTGQSPVLIVSEGGVPLGANAAFAQGDRLAIAFEDGMVRWSQNGVVLFTRPAGSLAGAFIDSSFSQGMSTLEQIEIRPIGLAPNSNADADGFPNAFDLDSDGDSLTDANEIGALDFDRDGLVDDVQGAQGSVGIPRDSDGDGMPDFLDLESHNAANDGTDFDVVRGGYAEFDSNGDGRIGQADLLGGVDLNFNGMDDLTEDFDRDGLPNPFDSDDDNDGVLDTADAFPFDADETQDSDGDGVGDIGDFFPFDPSESADADFDGVGDNSDIDADNDGIRDETEQEGQSEINDWLAVTGGVVADGNSLSFTDAGLSGWVSQAVSKRASQYGLTGDYEFSWRIGNQTSFDFWIAGLGNGDSSSDYSDVDYGFYVATGTLYMLESGALAGVVGSLSLGDRLSIAVEAGVLSYRQNGQTVRTVNLGGTPDLHFDSAFANGTVELTDIKVGTPGQLLLVRADQDFDGVDNQFDLDSDGDTIPDCVEAGFVDANFDGILDNLAQQGSILDPQDSDGDGLPDYQDLESGNALNDGTAFDINAGIYANLDTNADGIFDGKDLLGGFDLNQNGLDDLLEDPDGDGVPSELDGDDDGDGVPDGVDVFPFDPNESADADNDGVGDIGDAFPNDPNETSDVDGDGAGDNGDIDSDNDGFSNMLEPLTALDLDSDNDGVLDVVEAGLGDTDNDGFVDSQGLQGSVAVAPDSDSDGIADYLDLESGNPLNDGTAFDLHAGAFAAFDTNGDGLLDGSDIGGDADADGDGINDLIDRDPTRFGNMEADCDADGIPDTQEADCNGNGTPDECETFTDCNSNQIPDECEPDCDGDGVPDACDPCTPVANFTFTPESCAVPMAVTFTDQSLHGPTSWAWSFGDGGTSNQQNPTHVYSTIGVYSPQLTVSGLLGIDTITKFNGVNVTELAPVAEFSAAVLGGRAPLDVQFADTSTGLVVSYLWDFGDGATSTQPAPMHRYVLPGVYSVELTATNAGGSDSELKLDYITVGNFIPGIVDGSFEFSAQGGIPILPWLSMLGTNTVVRTSPPLGDTYFPTEGDNWLQISADGSDNAVPPTNPLGLTGPSIGGARVSQVFHFDPAGDSILRFEAALLLNGNLGDLAQNDWMSVEVSDGAQVYSLFYADSFSGFPRFSTSEMLSASVLELAQSDLRVLFPTATLSTPLTLTAAVGNGGDGALPSIGYLDNVHLAVEDEAAVRILGCGVNPYGSLTATGTPKFGGMMTVHLDNPLGTTCPGTGVAVLLLSNASTPSYPCGAPFPLHGMDGFGSELFIGSNLNFLDIYVASQWTGSGSPADVDLFPMFSPGLVGRSFYAQGVFFDAGAACGVRFGVTDGIELVLGY